MRGQCDVYAEGGACSGSPLSAGRKRVGALAEDGQIAPVAEHPPPSAARDFFDDTETYEIGEGGVHGWSRQSGPLDELAARDERSALHQLMDT